MGDGLNFSKSTHFTLKAGIDNKVVDTLSNRVFVLTKMSTMVNGFEKLRIEYKSCPDFCEIYAILKDGATREVDEYTLQDRYLFLGRKLYIPRTSLREFLVWELHVDGQVGYFRNEKTIKAVNYGFYWPSPKRDIAKHVGKCHTC